MLYPATLMSWQPAVQTFGGCQFVCLTVEFCLAYCPDLLPYTQERAYSLAG